MSADNLPRPSTPGPWGWEAADGLQLVGLSDIATTDDPPVVIELDGSYGGEIGVQWEDRPAIAALPQWIDAHDAAVVERDALQRRMDAVRAYCEGGHRHVSAAHVLSLLDGEAGE